MKYVYMIETYGVTDHKAYSSFRAAYRMARRILRIEEVDPSRDVKGMLKLTGWIEIRNRQNETAKIHKIEVIS